jgi:23S rRNA pseudouridine1911/1915/1917 synthase
VELLDILYEDNHLLVVNKPAGIATMGADNLPTVHSLAADYLKRAYNKPGRVYVGIVSRLDAMTSGVLVLARTSKAARRLSAQFANVSDRRPLKIYLVAVEGQLDGPGAELVDYLRKDDVAKRMRVVGKTAASAQQARLRYMTLGEKDGVSVAAAQLLSGRKHQIRVQFADRVHPVLGDRKYGARGRFSAGVALHSWRLQIIHPTRAEPIWFEAEIPRSWKPLRHIMPATDTMRLSIDEFFQLPSDQAR